MGVACLYLQKDHHQAGIHLHRACELNPSDTHASVFLSRYEALAGNPEGALRVLEDARRHNPFWKYDWSMFVSHVVDRQYDKALGLVQSVQNPAPQMLAAIAVVYARTGNLERANCLCREYMEIASKRLGMDDGADWKAFVLDRIPIMKQEDRDEFLEGLKLAGFPD